MVIHSISRKFSATDIIPQNSPQNVKEFLKRKKNLEITRLQKFKTLVAMIRASQRERVLCYTHLPQYLIMF